MQLVVHASPEQKQAFLGRRLPEDVQVHWFEDDKELPAATAYFDLLFEDKGQSVFNAVRLQPVFVNAVLAERAALAKNMIRINAWPGFLERRPAEIAAIPAMTEKAATVMNALQWPYQLAPDMPGMIAVRIIAMIINEAYFGLGNGISTRSEIDTAMKLGTNYPYGPFEWSEKIGLAKIHTLLQTLSRQDARYAPAPALLEDYAAINR